MFKLDYLNVLMKRKNISVEDLKKHSKSCKVTIERLFKGQSSPKSPTIEGIAKALNIPSEVLSLETLSSILEGKMRLMGDDYKSCSKKFSCSVRFLENINYADIDNKSNNKIFERISDYIGFDVKQYLLDFDDYGCVDTSDIDLRKVFRIVFAKEILNDSIFELPNEDKLNIKKEYELFLCKINNKYRRSDF